MILFYNIHGDNMKILCIGHAAYDITIPLDKFVIENTKNRVDERVECGGGPASNAAYLLGKWGCDVTFMGVVGNDEYGRYIKKELDSVNVNTDYLELSSEYKTTSSFIIANKSNGTRTILTYRPKEMKMKEIDLSFEPDIILVDGQEYNASDKILKKYPKAISIIDAGRTTEEVIDLAKKVKYLVCSKDFAEKMTNEKFDFDNLNSLSIIYQKMKDIFKNEIIITLESHGVLYEHNHKLKLLSGIKKKAIDTTGAGDIFHGAFTYGISQRWEIEKVIRLANVTAGLSVTKIGGRFSIFDLDEIKELYNEFK